ncbi:MAG: lactate racemase domain-containing protein [Planctomycetota bacterium]
MRTSLLYGRGTLEIEIPAQADVAIIRKPEMPVLSDPDQAVRDALTELPAIAAGANSACIAICDITRPVPNQLFLRPMVEMLAAAGIPYDRITILIATGLHRPNLGDELVELIEDHGCSGR